MMCVKQQQKSLKLMEADVQIAASPQVSEADDETTRAINGSSNISLSESVKIEEMGRVEFDSQSSSQAETQTPLKQPLAPEKPFPLSPRKSKASKKKKSVRFDQAVTCRPSLHKKNYTKEETRNSFYSRREFEMIRRDLLQTLSLIQSGKFVEQDDDESCSTDFTVSSSSSSSRSFEPLHAATSRGLENFTVKGSLKSNIKKLRQKSITNVLVEQDFQVDQAESMNLNYLFYDDEAIRDSYKKCSKIAAEAARKRGVEDYHIASGRAPVRTPGSVHTKKNFRNLFSKKSVSEKDLGNSQHNNNTKQQQHQPRQRRWSSFEKSTRGNNTSSGASEKKLNTKRWSLRSVKQNRPTAMIA